MSTRRRTIPPRLRARVAARVRARASRHHPRTELDGNVRVFQTVIPHGLRTQHATELHAPVIRLIPKSPVAQAYREVAAEVALLRSA